MEPIILASSSPQRQEYLKLLGLPFSCMPANINESFAEGQDPRAMAEELAIRKAGKIVESLKDEPPLWVLGADTLISLDGKIYAKAADRLEAERMLRTFQGQSHQVITAIALYNGRRKTIGCRSVLSTVTFAVMSKKEIQWYLDTGEWEGVAGAYRIQGLASCFISSIQGSYSSIVGLPLREIYEILKDNKYPF
ncbi:MAG: Maf family protein [Treponema sp.]|nr:Maf family protein [Treponema sp.]